MVDWSMQHSAQSPSHIGLSRQHDAFCVQCSSVLPHTSDSKLPSAREAYTRADGHIGAKLAKLERLREFGD